MTCEHDELKRTLKQIHVACRQANHDLGWICAVLSESDKPNSSEVARKASLQVADELDELVESIRMACNADSE